MLLFAGGNAWAAEVTLTYSEKGYTNAQSLDGLAVTVDGVTFQMDKATASNAPAYYDTGTAARVYPGATVTVSSTVGNITAITLNAVQGAESKGTTTLTADAGTLTDLAWTGGAESVVFTAAGKGHLRITSITVTTSEAEVAVKAPVASLANGSYFGTQSVELSCETEGATIYYTTDGTEPTSASTAYTAAIEISETTTIKAIAIKDADQSSVLTRTYTIGKSYENIAALVADATNGEQAQLTLTDAIVTYVNGNDVYVQDASGAIEFFKLTSIGETTLAAGSTLNGTAVVTYKVYNSLPEITALEGDVTVTEGEVPAATAMSVADALKAENLCKYVSISSAVVTEKGIVSGTDTLAIYDKWKTGITVYPGLYDQITGMVSTYNGTQLNFISADTTTLASVEEGVYYLKNVATGQYFCGANSWGTHASLNASGIDVTLARLADGTYTIDTQLSNGGTSHYLSDVWCDGAPTGHGFYAVEGAENTYYIAIAGGYLAYDGSTTALVADSVQNENAQWVLVSKEDRLAEMAQATQSNPVNATFLIQDPNFGRNDTRSSAWTHENHTNFTLSNGNNTNNCAESYHSTFTLLQKIALPAGVYSMTAQGFYRQDGSDTENLPVFYIGDSTAVFPVKTGSENNMNDASTSFSAGNYTIDPIYIEVEGDSITLGAKLVTNTNLWCIWDNFQLTYYGKEANIEQLKNAALYEQLATLIEEAKTLAAVSTMHSTKVEALNAAITAGEAAQAGSDMEAINAAITDLTAANSDATAYQKAGEILAQMKALTESTNVYTEEALETYYSQWQAKYDDGTITEEEVSGLQNPYEGTSWHAALTCDDFLMSAWDQPTDFAGTYYINTWSVEGNTDGSEFKTPFFEYWTADASVLSADTLSATVKNLAPGEYTVSAVVRVRLSNSAAGAAPKGITLQANDGEAISVCEGTAYGQLYVDTVSVTGVVAEDSTLTIKFVVSDTTNVSWLSFQNVKYVAPVTELEIPVTLERETGLGYAGQTADLDFTEALAFLGISSVSDATVVGINVTDGSIVENAMDTYDGWHNADGDFQGWGDNAAVCVKFNPTAESAQLYDICDMGNANVPSAGESFTCKWGLQANGKTAIYVVTINFVEPVKKSYEIVKIITVNHDETEKTPYSGKTETFDVNEVITALGASAITDCEQYIVNVTDSSFVTNTTDGWRDANGDMASWGNAGGVCVKIGSPASGTIDYIGCYDDTHEAGETYHALWAFVYNQKAVLIDVTITFSAATGIQSLTNGESLKNAAIYTIGGQRVNNVTKGGIYIINGKKVLMK